MAVRLVLWGRRSSCNVQKVMWALEELQLLHLHYEVGGEHGGLDAPAYRTLNPNGLVPTLQDGELTIWESHAIVRYLSASYGRDILWRDTPAKRALVDQWTDWTACTFQPAWIRLFWLFVRTPAADHDIAAIMNAYGETVAALMTLDEHLSNRQFIAGTAISYADIVAGVSLFRWFTMDVDRPSLPGVEAWYARLQQRPGFRQAVMVSYDDLIGRLAY